MWSLAWAVNRLGHMYYKDMLGVGENIGMGKTEDSFRIQVSVWCHCGVQMSICIQVLMPSMEVGNSLEVQDKNWSMLGVTGCVFVKEDACTGSCITWTRLDRDNTCSC